MAYLRQNSLGFLGVVGSSEESAKGKDGMLACKLRQLFGHRLDGVYIVHFDTKQYIFLRSQGFVQSDFKDIDIST
jgi:hypothetical protein